MKCNHCGFEREKEFDYCPNCGTVVPKEEPVQTAPVVEPVSINPAADKILGAVRDNMFLAICILMTASCVLSLTVSGMPIINILITVFLWLTYSSAQKGFADEKQLRCVSGAVYANYVIMNITCGIFIVCGILFGVAFSAIAKIPEFISQLEVVLSEYNLGELTDKLYDIPQEIWDVFGWLIGVAFVIAAAMILVFNLLGMRKIHRFVKSVYMGIMFQNPKFENPRGAKGWLIFFGVCSGISALSSTSVDLASALGAGCSAAAAIIAAILIEKHIISETNNII